MAEGPDQGTHLQPVNLSEVASEELFEPKDEWVSEYGWGADVSPQSRSGFDIDFRNTLMSRCGVQKLQIAIALM